MRVVDSASFNKTVTKDIEKLLSASRKINPDNVNVFSYDFALDTQRIDEHIPYAGQAMINSVDVSKLNAAIAHLKAHKQLYRDDVFYIPRFSLTKKRSCGYDSDGVMLEMSANNAVFDITVPTGWSGQKALVSWFIGDYQLTFDSGEGFPPITRWFDSWELYFATLWNSTKENTTGWQIFQNDTFIRVVFTFEKIDDKMCFPGMTIIVRYFRAAI
ncbi:MAG: hypothetical protein N2234_08180 [Planctomycetota bacterium]|nr:hypothetical protein [Planctomycetota bacterium]